MAEKALRLVWGSVGHAWVLLGMVKRFLHGAELSVGRDHRWGVRKEKIPLLGYGNLSGNVFFASSVQNEVVCVHWVRTSPLCGAELPYHYL